MDEAVLHLFHRPLLARIVLDFGQAEQGQLFMAMELIEGESLAKLIRTAPFEPERALRIADQVAQALAVYREIMWPA